MYTVDWLIITNYEYMDKKTSLVSYFLDSITLEDLAEAYGITDNEEFEKIVKQAYSEYHSVGCDEDGQSEEQEDETDLIEDMTHSALLSIIK